jgi:hypothetical protein
VGMLHKLLKKKQRLKLNILILYDQSLEKIILERLKIKNDIFRRLKIDKTLNLIKNSSNIFFLTFRCLSQ